MAVKSPKNPSIAIIIPALNAGRTLDETFAHLFGGTSMNGSKLQGLRYPGQKTDVIVVDGGSRDETLEIVKKWQKKHKRLRLIQVPRCKSPGQARNAALKWVKNEILLFLDSDCAPNQDWVGKMIQPLLRDPKIGMVGGELYTLQFDPQNKVEHYCEQIGFLSVGDRVGMKEGGYYPPVRKNMPREVNGSQTCPFFSMANAAVSRKAALAVGNHFWEEGAAEDVDFSLRLSKAGYKLFFQPDAVVRHMHRANLGEFCRQVRGQGLGRPLAIKAHAKRVLEIRLQLFGEHSLPVPFPFQAMIYWGDFHFMHLFGIWALVKTVGLASQGDSAGVVMGSDHLLILWGLFMFFFLKYFLPVLKIQPASDFLLWSWIRYRSNLAMLWGGLMGIGKFGRIYIELSL